MTSPTVIGECLLAWLPPPPDGDLVDAKVAARVAGEFMIRVIAALTKKKK